MRTLARCVAMLTAASLSGCRDSMGSSTLAAPTNLSVSYLQSATSWHYTFSFTAVEFADNYLIYYSVGADHSTAVPLASGSAPPTSTSARRAGCRAACR